MKSLFITTIFGEDKPYIIQSLAETTRRMGGEWLKSKVMHLDGRFTTLMKVSIDKENEQKLKDKLEDLYSELAFHHSPISNFKNDELETVNLVVDCKDRSGLTHDIAAALSDLSLKAETMEVHRFPVTPVGGTVYSASLSIQVPNTIIRAELVKALEAISENSRVTIK